MSILYCRLRRNVLAIAGAQAEKLVAEKILNLRGLKCPLPALRVRKALTGLKAGDMLIAEGNPILFGRRLEIIKDTDGHARHRVRGAEVVLGPVL